ncbi:MAG: adenylate/guanylate cyclase domain-containing protein [Rubrivivax sp.]|nr:adenylate/guanylate cyclase domain-containing protein [Rubrivivax sp.]
MECAVLFADVAGSTALYELLGDEPAFALVEDCLATMSACTTDCHGRVVKTIGDAVMAVFDRADDAAAAAAEMQVRVAGLGEPRGVQLGVRIGFHFGPVVPRDGDVFGDSVNLASRLCDLASKGQVITDEETARQLSSLHAANLRTLFPIEVKGKAQEIALVEILWQAASQEMTAIVAAPAAGDAAGWAHLTLEVGGERLEMGPERRKATFGRDHEADFTVRSPTVSRAHAMIERRRERFVLVDHSLNGSFVTFEGKPEIKVRHEELTLIGHGWIAFGEPRAQAQQVAEFHCIEHPRPPP